MQKIIIFEGHDKSGKSTIAKELSKRLNMPIFKAKRDKYWWDPAVNLNYFTEGITQFIEQTGTSVILDRWMPSDFVYSQLFNRDISYKKIFDIDYRLSKLNVLLVICYKDKENYIPDDEDKDFVDENVYAQMTDLYQDYVGESEIRTVLWLNTSDENLEEQLSKITKLI